MRSETAELKTEIALADSDVTVVEIASGSVSQPLREELLAFWANVFQIPFAAQAGLLAGEELAENRDLYYLLRSGSELVATCHLTISRLDPRWGGLGEVATHPGHRGQGLASQLVERAVQEFDRSGGQHLWLGTVNPVAASVYEKFGFRYVPRSKVMLRATTAFPAFQEPIEIVPGGAEHRLTMIPLILHPNDSAVLDVNCHLLSTRVAEQTSCMGLYPRYDTLGPNGHWFAAQAADGMTVGLGSVQRVDAATARIDAFIHPGVADAVLQGLYRQSMKWAAQQGYAVVQSYCPAGDARKTSALTALQFQPMGQAVVTVATQAWMMTVFSRSLT